MSILVLNYHKQYTANQLIIIGKKLIVIKGMKFVIDESGLILLDSHLSDWKIATVVGVMLPFKAHQKWVKKYSNLGKGSKINDGFIIKNILKDLLRWKAKGVLAFVDHGHTTPTEMAAFRQWALEPTYAIIENTPAPYKEALLDYLSQIKNLKDQEFAKTFVILDVICKLIELVLSNQNKLRSIDKRLISLLVDTQIDKVCPIIKHFIHYFLYCRAGQGSFKLPTDLLKQIRWHVHHKEGKTYLNTNSFFKKILVVDDDAHPEIKAADCLANFTRRALRHGLPDDVIDLLAELLPIRMPIHFKHTQEYLDIKVPQQAQYAIAKFSETESVQRL